MPNGNDFEILEVEEIGNLNGLQVYQQDKALIDMQITTAKRYPRNLKKAIENAITVVTMNNKIAESCTYSLRKGKLVTGPSVRLAEILAQQMGNMRIENRVVGFDDKHVTCEAICFDLERNFAIRTQIKRSIIGSNGRFSEDMCTIVGNAGNSIALRNAIFKVIPQEIIDQVYEASQEKITGDLSDKTKLIARRNKVFEGFKQNYHSLGLTDEEICMVVDKSSVSHITKEDITALIGFEKSLGAGEMAPEELFRPNKKIVRPKQPEDKSAERILALINASTKKADLEKLFKDCNTIESKAAYDNKFKTLK